MATKRIDAAWKTHVVDGGKDLHNSQHYPSGFARAFVALYLRYRRKLQSNSGDVRLRLLGAI